jgi:hypothetical protein
MRAKTLRLSCLIKNICLVDFGTENGEEMSSLRHDWREQILYELAAGLEDLIGQVYLTEGKAGMSACRLGGPC